MIAAARRGMLSGYGSLVASSLTTSGTVTAGTLAVTSSATIGTTLGVTGDLNASGPLNIFGVISQQGVHTPTQITANTDNWAGISTTATIARVSTDASRNLTGIVAPATNRTLTLDNVGAFDLVLVHDATSTAANRFLCPGSVNFTLTPNMSVTLRYDLTSSRWRVET